MNASVCIAPILILLLLVPAIVSARHIDRQRSHHGHHHPTRPSNSDTMVRPGFYWERRSRKHRRADAVDQVAGSTLPDCSHACGSCTPCRLVMVSFVCSTIEEAETCPIAYKCMCNNKSYPVP
ncbi:protein EPIDERMAL PATTERNING FACTOR 1-like [Cornus florida]|uniref:protein EPIDERMAL PATTERNING FACTOR 1-like n=1 Tax=Cornus florida TaxID=4283 RepID=UPI00289B2370|nr:protein EPIDERMAL PATTERNING FACTOR 1-like [Cornus florida]